MSSLTNFREKLNEKLVEYKAAKSMLETEKKALLKADEALDQALEAQNVVQHVAQAVQQKVNKRIASVVTRCLEAVFEEPYEFNIKFERKRGKTEAVLQFLRDGLVLSNPMDESGGGAIDVAALASRLASLVLTEPKKRRVLLLDEPFAKVRGIENRRRMKHLIESLARDFECQFVINVDEQAYPEFTDVGKVIDFN